MSEINTGGAAFPRPFTAFEVGKEQVQSSSQTGMTLRDWFAGQSLAGMFNHIGWIATFDGDADEVAKRSYDIADAMLAAREVAK